MSKSKLFLVILVIQTLSTISSFASEKPKLMIALGDSISAGTLADTTLRGPDEKYSPEILDAEIQELKTKLLYENKKTLAWPSGNKIESHWVRLAQTFPKDSFVIENLAVPGAKAQDLYKQLDELFSLIHRKIYGEIAYITLLIGSNDACSSESDEGTPNLQFKFALDSVFLNLAKIRQSQKIRILVSSIPRIPDLGMPAVQNSRTIAGISCKSLRSFVNLCPSLVQWKTPSEYSEKLQLVIEKNLLIQEAVEKANREFKNLDIVFTSRAFEEKITPDLVAADCFHPNQKGQEAFAQKLWAEQPWF